MHEQVVALHRRVGYLGGTTLIPAALTNEEAVCKSTGMFVQYLSQSILASQRQRAAMRDPEGGGSR